MLTVFVVVYATTTLALPKQMLLDAVMYAALFELITLPIFGWLSDKIGRRPFFIMGAIFTIAFAFPLFWMLETKSVAMVTMAIIVAMNFGHGMMFGLESTYFPELFGPRVRYSGASFGFQVAAAIGGGFSPIIATALVGLLRRNGRRLGHDDRDRAHHVVGRACRPGNQGRSPHRLKQDRFNMRFGIFIYDGVEPIDLATFGVLSMARRIAPQIEICTIAPKAGIVRLSNGLDVIAQFGIEDAPACDIVIVTGGPGWEDQSRSSATLDVHPAHPRVGQDRVGMYGSHDPGGERHSRRCAGHDETIRCPS